MPEDPEVVTREELNQRKARAAAREAASQGREQPIDEAPPGGRYKVGDQWLNADGEPLKGAKSKAEG